VRFWQSTDEKSFCAVQPHHHCHGRWNILQSLLQEVHTGVCFSRVFHVHVYPFCANKIGVEREHTSQPEQMPHTPPQPTPFRQPCSDSACVRPHPKLRWCVTHVSCGILVFFVLPLGFIACYFALSGFFYPPMTYLCAQCTAGNYCPEGRTGEQEVGYAHMPHAPASCSHDCCFHHRFSRSVPMMRIDLRA
jgi:hypothetical protein